MDISGLLFIINIILYIYIYLIYNSVIHINKIYSHVYLFIHDEKKDDNVEKLLDNQALLDKVIITFKLLNLILIVLMVIQLYLLINSLLLLYKIIFIILFIVVINFINIYLDNYCHSQGYNIIKDNCQFILFITTILTPITYIFNIFNNYFFHKYQDEENDTSEELLSIVEDASNDGDLSDHETTIISNAIEFKESSVKEILTPRIKLIAIDVNSSMDDIFYVFGCSPFSRLPVYAENIDHIIGVLHQKDFYNLYYQHGSDIKPILQKVIFTSTTTKISDLLKTLQTQKIHLAVVLDEYGGTEGIVTMEDILEQLVGDIYDEHDLVEHDYIQINHNTYLLKASVSLDDIQDIINIDNEETESITLGGWIMEVLDKIPKVNDSFTYKNYLIKVTKTNAKSIDQVKITIMDE